MKSLNFDENMKLIYRDIMYNLFIDMLEITMQ